MWGCRWDACRRARRGRKVPVLADDVWMARAVPGWATGGAGFTQQDVGVSSPAVPTLMYTQMQGYAHPKSQLSHTDDGGGCSLHALSWKWHVSLRRGIKWLEKEDCAMCLQRLVHKDWRISQLKSDAHYKCLQNFFLSKISLPAAEVPLGLLPNLLDVSVLDQCGLRE